MEQTAGDSTVPDVERPATWAALVVLATFSIATSGIMPMVAQLLVEGLRFGSAEAGRVSSLYSLAGIAAGAAGLLWIRRADLRVVLVTAVLAGLAADLSAVWLHGHAAIAAGRFVSGFAGTSVMIVTTATIARANRSDRLFGIVVTCQSLLAAMLFFILPTLWWGVPELFSLLAVLWLLSLPCALLVPRRVPRRAEDEGPGRRSVAAQPLRPAVVPLVLALLCFYVATGACWTYANLIGHWHGIGDRAIGEAMSAGMLLAIAGGASVTALGSRVGRFPALASALVASCLFTGLLLTPVGAAGFAIAVCGIDFFFTFALALFLASFGAVDREGGLFSIANLVICAGLTLGPWLLGPSTGGGSYAVLLLGTIAFFAASLVLVSAHQIAQARPTSG